MNKKVEQLKKEFKKMEFIGEVKFGKFKKDYNEFVEEILSSFHADSYETIELEDDYFMHIRANNFVIEKGWSEELFDVIDDDLHMQRDVYILTANHKGIRVSKVYVGEWYLC